MTNLIEMLAIPAVAIGTYIIASKHLTKFLMNGGKSIKQIIDTHKNNSGKKYLIKYPEADIKTSKHFIMALGFIFAFASSIYAFSIYGEQQTFIPYDPIVAEGDFEIIPPSITMEEKAEIKKKTPKKMIAPEIILVDEIPPKLEQEKKEVEVTKKEVMADIIIEDKGDDIEVKEKDFVIVEDMPMFKGCEGSSKEEIEACTLDKIQRYIARMDVPQIIIERELGGQVHVKFVVAETGEVEDVEVLIGANSLLDKAVVNRVKSMPKFASPGRQRGKEVRVQYIIPVNIILE